MFPRVLLFIAIACLVCGRAAAFTASAVVRRAHRTALQMAAVQPVKGGSVVALVTPMTKTNDIDYDKFVDLLNWHVKEGSDGAVILGTTGEGSMINIEERSKLIKLAVATVKGAFPITVGTGTIETSKVIELCRNAKDCGADASLVITPYYVKPPQRALVAHYTSIADAIALPMIVYNCPGRTGVDMKPETVALLAKHPRIVGIKDATGDLGRIAPLRKVGADTRTYPPPLPYDSDPLLCNTKHIRITCCTPIYLSIYRSCAATSSSSSAERTTAAATSSGRAAMASSPSRQTSRQGPCTRYVCSYACPTPHPHSKLMRADAEHEQGG